MKLKNKKVLVVGLGKSGLAAVEFLKDAGAKVAVTDLKADVGGARHPPEADQPRSPLRGLECHFGKHPPEIFDGRDLIVVSPGVPWGEGLQRAAHNKIPILGELELAARFLQPPVIAVTGTNGKTTTTLLGELLGRGGKKVEVAGNIGKPLVEVVMEGRKLDWVVAEVSSYQLETVDRFHPRVAVLLNVTEDHLDRYASMEAYARAKYRIFSRQTSRDLAIYNQNDSWCRQGMKKVKAKKIGFSSVGAHPCVRPNPGGRTRGRHTGLPLQYIDNQILYRNGRATEAYPLDRVTLVGQHNVENIMASVAAARFCGVEQKSIQKTLGVFRGLPHRIELVRECGGVRYYDDSKGTNVDAVIRALEGFPDHSVLLIAGGKEKGGSYAPLREMMGKKVKHLFLIGEAKVAMAREFKGVVPVSESIRLETALPSAARMAVSGDVVLLSPACSSFDQFKDYKERGDLFQKLVKGL